jgi:hypothetical protein
MKHLVTLSGGHSSGIVSIEVTRKFGKENVILLNHDINPSKEDKDIKRFKKEVANYLGLPITYANFNDLPVDELPDQFEVCEEAGSFVNPHDRNALCTNRLKTGPFTTYLKRFHHDRQVIIYYGFDETEPERISRRSGILKDMGYESDYPIALWSREGVTEYNRWEIQSAIKIYNKVNNDNLQDIDWFLGLFPEYAEFLELRPYKGFNRTIFSTGEIGIEPPNTYNKFKHANCTGCLKGGQQHWYVVYCNRYDVFERAKLAEERIGYSIIKGFFLKDIEEKFYKMKLAGVPDSEHIPYQTFWATARKYLKELENEQKPCECFI